MHDVTVLSFDQFVSNMRIVTADCFFYQALPLLTNQEGIPNNFSARVSRIIVSDADAPLHYHHGATIAIILGGWGIVKTADGAHPVQSGDIVLIPAGTRHVSQAAAGTTMIEYTVFIGDAEDFEAVE